MNLFLTAFLVSLVCTAVVIRCFRLHGTGADDDLSQPQKFHVTPTPRLGGVGLAAGLVGCCALLLLTQRAELRVFATVLLCGSLAFAAGLWEDLHKNVSAMRRLAATCASAALAVWLADAAVQRMGFATLDLVFAWYPLAAVFTILAVGGMANAINIIDGFNGLASMVSVMMFGSMGYVAWQVGDASVLALCLASMGAVFGFFVWNFPKGMIFLGDGGAYLLGFLLAECAVLLVQRNPVVSPWYVALLFIYPIFETLFSTYRRFVIRGRPIMMPDGVHLHSLLFRRIMRWTAGSQVAAHITLRNSMTSPYLWLLCALAVFPATVWWRSTWVMLGFTLLFCITYVWLYASIVRFSAPKWLIFRK